MGPEGSLSVGRRNNLKERAAQPTKRANAPSFSLEGNHLVPTGATEIFLETVKSLVVSFENSSKKHHLTKFPLIENAFLICADVYVYIYIYTNIIYTY